MPVSAQFCQQHIHLPKLDNVPFFSQPDGNRPLYQHGMNQNYERELKYANLVTLLNVINQNTYLKNTWRGGGRGLRWL